MISVAERLLASWLDSQGERRYQPAFIQALIASGWTVLHNTRHSQIELGKDVIARDPDGVLHCFQLKGNPGSRLTKREASGLLNQFDELLIAPGPEFRKTRNERHVAVFVTNGEIDEEARLLFERAGEKAGQPGVAASSYELWARGKVLSMFKPTLEVWPASTEATRLILNLLAGDGRAQPSPTEIASIMLALMPPPDEKSPGKTAALSSMLVIAEIIKSRWYETDNHQALHAATVLASVAALSLADNKKRLKMVQNYAPLALEHCADLMDEARKREFDPDLVWFESDPLSEFDVQWERRRLVADCAAVLLLGDGEQPPERSAYASRLVRSVAARSNIWGQAQIPSMIVGFWARSKVEAGLRPELDFAEALAALIRQNGGSDESEALPQPYYGFEDVWALLHEMPHATDSPIFDDTALGRVFFARAMMMMLAKRNLKANCRRLWRDHTRVMHEESDLADATFFTAQLAEEGGVRVLPVTMGYWRDLVDEAIDGADAPFLGEFGDLAWLIAAYISLVPYRAWTNVILWLDERLAVTWYNRSHRPR